MKYWRIILATVVIFGAGVVTGGLLVGYVQHVHPDLRRADIGHHHPPGAHELSRSQRLNRQFVEKLDAAVHLTPAQRRQIEKIIAEGQERNHDLWKLVAPQFHAVMRDVHRRICVVLRPEQRKRFEALVKEMAPHRPAPKKPRSQSPAPAGGAAPTNAPGA